MLVNEIFHSIQGEGIAVGVPCVFLRLSGCNLRCAWCDTPYASWNPEGEVLSIDEIVLRCLKYESRVVVITGGEPFMHKDLPELCIALKVQNFEIHFETAGTIFKEVVADLVTVSPKLASSAPNALQHSEWNKRHLETTPNISVLQQFLRHYKEKIVMKFVVDQTSDLMQILALIEQLPELTKKQIVLMPQARTALELQAKALWVAQLCIEHGFRYGDRIHVRLWGDKRGV